MGERLEKRPQGQGQVFVGEDGLAISERDKYEEVWSHPRYGDFSPGERAAPKAIQYLNAQPGSTFIDFGTGSGKGAKALRDIGMNVIACVDHVFAMQVCQEKFVGATLWDMPEMHADFGFCVDVMEHLPEEKVDDVIAQIKARCDRCFWQIDLIKDGFGSAVFGEGHFLHTTLKSDIWWEQRVGGRIVEPATSSVRIVS